MSDPTLSSEAARQNEEEPSLAEPLDPPPLVDEDFERIARWATERTGASVGSDQRERIRQRLEPMRADLEGGASWRELYRRLRSGSERDSYAADAIRRLTNKESYFFRESAHLRLLTQEVIPARLRVLRAQGRKDLRILSAGCGRGQEPYSIAMTVADSGKLPPGYEAQITALDVDTDALARAREASYTVHSLRGVSEAATARFFRPIADDRYEVRPAYRRHVRFEAANLASPDWVADRPPFDVAFCRNVLIYLTERAQEAALNAIHDALAPGGYLFVGHVENLRAAPGLFVAHRRPDATLYQRPPE